MKYSDLENSIRDKAPKKGWMLAYTREKVIFEEYDKSNIPLDKDEDLLEIHLFDNNKEYRAIVSESPRFTNGIIEVEIPEEKEVWEEEDTYTEHTIIDFNGIQKRLVVINHISYDENGMANIDNYRLMMGGESDDK